MNIDKKEQCKHEWIYSDTVSFYDDKNYAGHYRIVHHCKKCGQLDIQTIYR